MARGNHSVAVLAVVLAGCGGSGGAPSSNNGGAAGSPVASGGQGANPSTGGRSAGTGGATGGRTGTGGTSDTGGSSSGGTGNFGAGGRNPGTWKNATGDLAGVSSVCGNSYRIWGVPGQDEIIAGISRVGPYATTDGGTTWKLLGASTAPKSDLNGALFDPKDSKIFWLAGMHAGPGVSKTTDGGTSFATLGSIGNIDDVSVDFTDPERKVMLAGAHETHVLYKSTNGGTSFTDITSSFPAGPSFTSSPIVIDAKNWIVGTAYYSPDPSAGVFRSTDAGATWTRMINVGVGGSGLKTSWGTLFFGTRGGGAVLRGSADGSTWSSLPVSGGQAYSIVIELPDNRIATTANSSIVASSDEGKTWTVAADKVPKPSGWSPSVGPYLAYDSVRGSFFVSYWDCGTKVHADAIWRYDVP